MQRLSLLSLTYSSTEHLQASQKGIFVHWDKSVRYLNSSVFYVHHTHHHVGRTESFRWCGKFRHGVLCNAPDSRPCLSEYCECLVLQPLTISDFRILVQSYQWSQVMYQIIASEYF